MDSAKSTPKMQSKRFHHKVWDCVGINVINIQGYLVQDMWFIVISCKKETKIGFKKLDLF